jgi:prophage regulatory protein
MNTKKYDQKEYVRAKLICATYPLSPASLWRKVKNGTFPKPIKLSAGITAWKVSDLLEWEKDPIGYGSTS